MHQDFVWNSESFPATSREEAYRLLTDALKGLNAAADERCTLFSTDFTTLRTRVLAPNYTYEDFLNELTDRDFELWLREIDDKTPSESYWEAAIDDLGACEFYFPDEAYPPASDVLALAWHVEGVLVSIASKARWQEAVLKFAQHPPEGYTLLSLPNIASIQHGQALNRHYENLNLVSLTDQFEICQFNPDFEDWFKRLDLLNQQRIRDKLTHAVARNFQGGLPLFKTLSNADGLRELRLRAYPGGAIRILFNPLPAGQWAILIGFLKKSDDEGYDEAIAAAKIALTVMLRF